METASAEYAGLLRVRLLRVLRASGDRSVAAASAEYDRLTGTGVTGTTGEMRLLAAQLTAAGAGVCLDPPTRQERLALRHRQIPNRPTVP